MKYELYELSFESGKKYIGISQNSDIRFKGHVRAANSGSSLLVHNAIRKYGAENVSRKILCIGKRDYIAALEIEAIRTFNTLSPNGYNLALGGDISPMHNPEIAAKVSAIKKINCANPEFRKRMVEISTGLKRSDESKQKMRDAHLGKKMPEDQRLRMLGRPPTNKGVPHSPEARKKNSDAKLRFYAEKRARGESLTISAEQKAKISASLMGHPGSGKGLKRPEISAQMSTLKWITNEVECRRIPKDTELPDGWRFGKTHNKRT